MSSFKDDIGFWRTKHHRRTSRKHGKSKKEIKAFERGIIVGMKTSFNKSGLRSVPIGGKSPLRRFSTLRQPMIVDDFHRLSSSQPIRNRRFSTLRPGIDVGRYSKPVTNFYGKPLNISNRHSRRRHNRALPPHTPPRGSPQFWSLGRRRRSSGLQLKNTASSNAANAMRMYQRKRKTHPGYTLSQAWKDVRGSSRSRSHRFGSVDGEVGGNISDLSFGEVGGNVPDLSFGEVGGNIPDLSFGEDAEYAAFGGNAFGHAKVAFGRPSFGRPQLTL